MINFIGKFLVILNVAMSMVFLTFALALFTNQVDWGWKEPRKELGQRVPSEIDKRAAALKSAVENKVRLEKKIASLQRKVDATEQNWASYHVEYNKILTDMFDAPADKNVEVKLIQMDPKSKGDLYFDPTQPGKVVFQKNPDGSYKKVLMVDVMKNSVAVNKSFTAYDELFRNLQQQTLDTLKNIGKEVLTLKSTTEKMTGVFDPKGEKVKPGIYDLLEDEKKLQKTVQTEIEHLRPLWVRKLVDAQLLISRKNSLESRVRELETKIKAKKIKN